MIIQDLINADEIPSLAMSLRFSAQRQRLIAHNIANISTPDYRPLNVSVEGFRRSLAEAIDARRSQGAGARADLPWRDTREVKRLEDGSVRLNPQQPSDNILFHDRNNRDLERLMQDLVENAAAHRVSADLLRSRFDLIRTAIAGRV